MKKANRDGYLNENEIHQTIWFPTPDNALVSLAQEHKDIFQINNDGSIDFLAGLAEFEPLGWTGKVMGLDGKWVKLGKFYQRNQKKDASVEHAKSITIAFFQ